jgi:hypothetical protein
MTPQLARISGTVTVRLVTSCKSREQEFSRIRRSHGKRNWRGNTERAYPPIEHPMADQFAHVERDLAVVFDGALAFSASKRRVGQPFAGDYFLPPRLGLAS